MMKKITGFVVLAVALCISCKTTTKPTPIATDAGASTAPVERPAPEKSTATMLLTDESTAPEKEIESDAPAVAEQPGVEDVAKAGVTVVEERPPASEPSPPADMDDGVGEMEYKGESAATDEDDIVEDDATDVLEWSISTGEEEATDLDADEITTSEEAVAGVEWGGDPAALVSFAEIKCFQEICLGNTLEDVKRKVSVGKLAVGAESECNRGSFRKYRLPSPVEDIDAYVFNNKCGGYVDHVLFRFYDDKLLGMSIYFRGAKFDKRTLDEFLQRSRDYLGEPYHEAWEDPGRQGLIIWQSLNSEASLRILGARPFSLELVDTLGMKTAEAERKKKLHETGMEKAGKTLKQ